MNSKPILINQITLKKLKKGFKKRNQNTINKL